MAYEKAVLTPMVGVNMVNQRRGDGPTADCLLSRYLLCSRERMRVMMGILG
jgi:hypothetical protein